jgi:hypothetical protein
MLPAASGFTPPRMPSLPQLPQKAPTQKREPIWTALDPVSIRFGNDASAPAPAAVSDSSSAGTPKTDAPQTASATELKPAGSESTAQKTKLPLAQRVKAFLNKTTWGLFGLSTVFTVGAPVVHFNRPAPSALVVQSEGLAQQWQTTQSQETAPTGKVTTLQKMALVSYMAALADNAAELNPDQPTPQLLTGFNLTEKEVALVNDLVAEAKKTTDFQGTLALYNRFADAYLTQYNSPESVEQSKTNVAQFFAENQKELSSKTMWDTLLLDSFLYGLGGMTVTGGLLALSRKKKPAGLLA